MKKKYNKPLFIDTCILSNLLGLDEEKSNKNRFDFEKLCNKKILEKYIIHHGYLMSDYNLYEILRNENWNAEKVVKRLRRLNYRTRQKVYYIRPDPRYLENQIPSANKVKHYTNEVFHNIINFASNYYSSILLFPFYFNLCTFLFLFNKKKVFYDQKLMSKKTENLANVFADKIKKEFLRHGKYTKSTYEKVINKFFLISNHLMVVFYNEKMVPLYNKYELLNFDNVQNDIDNLVDEFTQQIISFDYNEVILRFDNSKTAKMEDTIMLPLAKNLLNSPSGEYNKDNLKNVFSHIVDKMIYPIYGLKDDLVRDIYFRNNIHDIYTKVLDENYQNKEIKRMLNGNDLLDLCGLSEAVQENVIFISTDSGINKVIDRIYTDEQKAIVNLFINFEFCKNDKS